MDYLTVKEVAELKVCSERYIQRLIKSGKMYAEQKNNMYNNQPCYMIPVSALSEDLHCKCPACRRKIDFGVDTCPYCETHIYWDEE